MGDEIGISVIMPVYKGIRFLREAMDSVRAQTFPDWECICVDDGSKDGSGALADEIAATEPRIRVIHQANGGTSVARNTALKVARGKYVAFLDEDDIYNPRMLEVLHDVAERSGADVVGCDVLWIKENGRPEFSSDGVPDERTWQVADHAKIAEWMTEMYPGIPYSIWINLYRRAAIAGHFFAPNVRVEQDLRWHYTLMPRISKYVRIPWTGYAWRETSAGGYLHPDAASLVSWTDTFYEIICETAGEMGVSGRQRSRLAGNMAKELIVNVWSHMRSGMAIDRANARLLRDGFRRLMSQGVDIRTELGRKKRLQWTLFLLTGLIWWVRRKPSRLRTDLV